VPAPGLAPGYASDRDDLDQIRGPDEVVGLAGVEPGAVGVRGGRDEQIRDACAW
jgi:hypothetical protein